MPGPIPQSFIDDVINRSDIVQVVGSYVSLKPQGSEFIGLCPFHNEKTPSFTVSPRKQFFYCFGCAAHGTVIGFLMRYANLDFVSAVEKLAFSLGLEVPRTPTTLNGHAEIVNILDRAQHYYGKQLERSEKAHGYLRARGVDTEIADRYALGYAPSESRAFIHALKKSEILMKNAVRAGLVIKGSRGLLPRFRNRIMFPIRDLRGNTVGFGGRTLVGGAPPKYMNSPETEIFHKSRLLYGLYEARQKTRQLHSIVVVEGYMDVLSIACATDDIAVVATLGTAISQSQIELALRVGIQDIIFCFDGDSAGRTAAWRALERSLPVLRPDSTIRFAFMPENEDPDSLIRSKGTSALESVLEAAIPASSFLLDALKVRAIRNTEDRALFLSKIRPYLRKIQDKIYRESLIADVAQALRLPNERVYNLLDNARESVLAATSKDSGPLQKPMACDPAIQRALALVVVAPKPAAEKLQGIDLTLIEFAGGQLLRSLLETIERNPHLTTAALLERWRDRPEGKLLGELPQKYASLWRLAEAGHDNALAEECRELLAKLVAESKIKAEFRSLRDGSRTEGDASDKERWRKLQELMAKEKNGH